jgi:hypothetical protein
MAYFGVVKVGVQIGFKMGVEHSPSFLEIYISYNLTSNVHSLELGIVDTELVNQSTEFIWSILCGVFESVSK